MITQAQLDNLEISLSKIISTHCKNYVFTVEDYLYNDNRCKLNIRKRGTLCEVTIWINPIYIVPYSGMDEELLEIVNECLPYCKILNDQIKKEGKENE